MLEAQALEEILIDDVGPGRDDRVHHVVLEERDDRLLEAGGDERARQREDDGALLVLEHHRINVGRVRERAAAVGHLAVGVDDGAGVERRDIDVLDGVGEQFLLRPLGHAKLHVQRRGS